MGYTLVGFSDSLRKHRISGGMVLANAIRFKMDQQNRLIKEEHVRTKPKLVAVNSTGGFNIKHK